MRRLAILLLLISSQSYAQKYFKVGLKEGMNTSQISGDTYKGFSKFGFVGGAYVKAKLKGDWTFGTEAIFTQKGSRHRSDYAKGDFNSYFLELNYVDIPILVQYNIVGFNIEFGPSVGFLVYEKEFIDSGGGDTNGSKSFNNCEFNLNLGANYTFKSRFGFNLRYTNSFLPVRDSPAKPNSYGQLNSVLTACLTFEFGSEGSMWK